MSQINQIRRQVENVERQADGLPGKINNSSSLAEASAHEISAITAINLLCRAPHSAKLTSLVCDVSQQVDVLVRRTADGIGCITMGMTDDQIRMCGLPNRRQVTSNLTLLDRVLSVLRQGPKSPGLYQSLNLGNLSKGFVAGALLGVGGILGPGLLESVTNYLAKPATPAQPTTLVSENPAAEKTAAENPPANEDANQRVNRGIRELRDNARNNVRGKQRTAPEHDPNHTWTEIPTKPDPQTPPGSTIIR